MASWLNHVAIAAPRNGTTSHTVTPSSGTVVAGALFTPTAGRLLVCLVEGAVTSTTPSGWTLPSGGSAVNFSGLYVWHRTAAGGDSLSTTHNASNYPAVFDFYEFPAGSTFIGSAAAIGVSASNGAGPTLSLAAGTKWVAGVLGQTLSETSGSPAASWGAGTKAVDTFTLKSGTDGYLYSLTYLEDSTLTSAQISSSSSSSTSTERLIFAVSVASGFDGAVSGTVVVQSAAAGTVQAARPVAGTSPAVTTAQGAPTSRQGVSGTVAALSTVTGTVGSGPKPIAGTVAVTSTTAGDVRAARPVAGAADVVSTATGAVSSRLAVAGTIAAVSGINGGPGSIQQTTGTVAAATTVSGEVSASRPVAGTVPITSTVSGAVELGGSKALSGTITAQSGTTGTVAARLGVTGTTPAQTATTGTVQALLPVSATLPAQSAAQGAVTALRPVAGIVSVTSTVVGAVDVAGSRALTGTIAVQSSASGAVQSRQRITGTVSVASDTAGALTSRQGIAGTTPAASTVTGTPSARYQVTGISVVVTTVRGTVGTTSAADAGPVRHPTLTLTIPVSAARLTIPRSNGNAHVPSSRSEIDMDGYTRNDTGPDLVITLASTPVVPLTGAGVKVHLRRPNGSVVTIPDGQVTFDPSTRTATLHWVTGDLATVGRYQLEVEATYSAGMVQTFPGAGFYVAAELA